MKELFKSWSWVDGKNHA